MISNVSYMLNYFNNWEKYINTVKSLKASINIYQHYPKNPTLTPKHMLENVSYLSNFRIMKMCQQNWIIANYTSHLLSHNYLQEMYALRSSSSPFFRRCWVLDVCNGVNKRFVNHLMFNLTEKEIPRKLRPGYNSLDTMEVSLVRIQTYRTKWGNIQRTFTEMC